MDFLQPKLRNSARFVFLVLLLSMICHRSGLGTELPIVEKRGGRVAVVKFASGAWQLQVDGRPYFIKGVVFTPVKIGESPEEATMRDWMLYDDDHNDQNDIAYQTGWSNDSKRRPVGDFRMLKEMGVNTIRLYHVASDHRAAGDIYQGPGTESITLQYDHPLNKGLLRSLYKDYGIRVLMGNFLGSWTVGTAVTWEEGTDYTNAKHLENIKKSVRAMVLDNKDEPYVLMWVLGNENNIADWSHCNAKQQPEAYARLVGELADMIHKLDPEHPVAVCDGDDGGRLLKYYAKFAKGIDAIGYNAYRGPFGFGTLWRTAHDLFDRPIFVTEFGAPAYHLKRGEDQDYQRQYLSRGWKDIVLQSSGFQDRQKNQIGVSIGGTIFDWTDRWYMSGTPSVHNPGVRPDPHSPDGISHEEYWGIVAMDGGSKEDSLMRRPRKAYDYFKRIWNQPDLAF